MSFNHYLPATYLANFSSNLSVPRRDSSIYVGKKFDGGIFQSKVSNVCGINNFYTLRDQLLDQSLIENHWTFYENKLHQSISDLCLGKLIAIDWLTVMVPFVCGLFVRGPDFNERFESRFAESQILSLANVDSTNFARVFESQRIAPLIISAYWTLLRSDGKVPLVVNELGYTPFTCLLTAEIGIAIPLNLEFILVITPCTRRAIITGSDNEWWPVIRNRTHVPQNSLDFNKSIAAYSQRFVFGCDRGVVDSSLQFSISRATLPVVDPSVFGFHNPNLGRFYEEQWIRLVLHLDQKPRNGEFLYVDYLNPINLSKRHGSFIFI